MEGGVPTTAKTHDGTRISYPTTDNDLERDISIVKCPG
jgi:hypothetical protein